MNEDGLTAEQLRQVDAIITSRFKAVGICSGPLPLHGPSVFISADDSPDAPRGGAASDIAKKKHLVAVRAVDAIIYDLSDRRGLRQEWVHTDAGIRSDIREEWIRCVEKALDTLLVRP